MNIDGLQVEFEVREDRLLVTASGTVSYQPAYSLLEQTLDTAKREHVSLILVDTLAVTGTLTTEDRYDLGLALAAYVALGARVKMAFVGKPTAGTGVMIAQNGGVNHRDVFDPRRRDELARHEAISFGIPVALPYAVTVKYRLLRRIVGMYKDDSGAIMIPAGSIVEIAPTRSKVGIIAASYDGRMIWVFLHDLLDAGRVVPKGKVG
jgi:hypothetical protein